MWTYPAYIEPVICQPVYGKWQMLDETECENAAELQAPFFWLPPERDKRPDGYPQKELQEKILDF